MPASVSVYRDVFVLLVVRELVCVCVAELYRSLNNHGLIIFASCSVGVGRVNNLE